MCLCNLRSSARRIGEDVFVSVKPRRVVDVIKVSFLVGSKWDFQARGCFLEAQNQNNPTNSPPSSSNITDLPSTDSQVDISGNAPYHYLS